MTTISNEFLNILSKDLDNINSKNNQGFNALICASVKGHLEVVKFLVENGIYINSYNEFGETPLILAASYGHFKVVKFLVESGASITSKTNNGTNGCS